jgi:hypothetical protein
MRLTAFNDSSFDGCETTEKMPAADTHRSRRDERVKTPKIQDD